MSGHTPGPWHCSDYRNWSFENWYGKHNEGLDIEANVKTDDGDDDYLVIARIEAIYYRVVDRTSREAKANARLIAAAPDLLEDLREMYHAFLDPDHIVTDRQEAASLEAHRAILKATGNVL